MNNYKKTFLNNCLLAIFLSCIFLLTSCSKEWLDVKADKRLTTPQTIQDLQAILDDTRNFNHNSSSQPLKLAEIAADNHYYTNEFYSGMDPRLAFLKNAYTWSIVQPFELISGYSNYYGTPYKNIASANVVLDAKPGDNEPAAFQHVQSQALFHRARILYHLAQAFAPAYNPLTANAELGLPLRLNTDLTEISVRSSVNQTYQQIIADLKLAAEHLPEVPLFLTRASKPAAYGLLARVYLTMGDYENAFYYSDEYLKIKNQLLDYNVTLPIMSDINLNPEIAFWEDITAATELGANYSIDQQLYNSYESNDLRKTVFFNAGSSPIKHRLLYSSGRLFAGVATDEQLLIRAECYARKGDFTNAMKDLNDLLRTRYKTNLDGSTTYVDQTAADETTALTKIFAERRKQLILRGIRRTDLRRFNQDPRFAVTLTRNVLGQQYTLEPGDPQYTFPFPQEVIDRSGMPQNAAWK